MVLRSISFKTVFGYGVNAPFWKGFPNHGKGAFLIAIGLVLSGGFRLDAIADAVFL